MTTLIEAKNINLQFSSKKILDDVSLVIKNDDFITIVGPNGAGKSMLLKCLIGLIKPNSGQITRKKGLKIGYVPQKVNISRSFAIKVGDFVKLNQKVTDRQIQQIAKETEIDKILDHQLNNLSGGELQRVLLARALVSEPEILILDEPAQNIDISGQLKFYKLLEKVYNSRKIAILKVSHDLHMVMALSKQVLCLYHHVCCHGKPQNIARDPKFMSIFGDDMAKMMAYYNHQHDHSHSHEEGCQEGCKTDKKGGENA